MIIGHGDEEGYEIGGATVDDMGSADTCSVVWLYSCNGGKNLAKLVSSRGPHCFGFISNICLTKGMVEVEICREVLSRTPTLGEPIDILRQVGDGLLSEAIRFLMSEYDFLSASAISLQRLALRFERGGSPPA